MAIVESEFIRQYPQYRREVEETMKFGNIEQQQAELKLAKKYRLPILDKLAGKVGFGSWAKMLKISDEEEKMAGAVMSTTAGLESKPRYRKKKKEEIISKRVKKVGGVSGRTPDGIGFIIDQNLGEKFEQAKSAYETWKSETTGASKMDIGVTGGSGYTDGKPKQFTTNLYEATLAHIDSNYQRPNQPKRRGVKGIWKRMDTIFGKELELITREDMDKFKTLQKQLKILNKNTKRNPRNIVFNVSTGAKKVGDKFVPEAKETVYGHYRTDGYVEVRNKVHGKKEKPLDNKDWYSSSPNTAEPPLWQSMFAGSSESKKDGDVVTKGLLHIVEIMIEIDKKPPPPIITNIDFKGLKFKMEEKAISLSLDSTGSLATEFEKRLVNAMKNPNNFKRGHMSHIIKYGNLLEEMGRPFRNVTISQEFLKTYQIAEFILEEENLVEVEFVDFSFTGVFLNYAINKIVRGKNSVIMAPDGKRPFQLRGSYKSTNSFSGEWESKYDDAIRRIKAKKQTKVKKSWGYSLWG